MADVPEDTTTTAPPVTDPEVQKDSLVGDMVGEGDVEEMYVDPVSTPDDDDEGNDAKPEDKLGDTPKGSDDPETKADTPPEGETKPETGDEALKGLMTELGLSNTYDGPEAVLRAHVESQGEATRGRQDAATLRMIITQMMSNKGDSPADLKGPPKAELTDELVVDWATNPTAEGFKKLMQAGGFGDSTKADQSMELAQGLQADMLMRNTIDALNQHNFTDVADYMKSNNGAMPPKGVNAEWDAVVTATKKFPGFASLPISEILGILQMTPKKVKSSSDKPPVGKISDKTKAETRTTSTNRGGEPGADGLPTNFAELDVPEMEKAMKAAGMWHVD